MPAARIPRTVGPWQDQAGLPEALATPSLHQTASLRRLRYSTTLGSRACAFGRRRRRGNKTGGSLLRISLQRLPCAATPVRRAGVLERRTHRSAQRGLSFVDSIGGYARRREDCVPRAPAD